MSLLGIRPAMFLVYSLLFSFGVILMAPYYLWRARGKTALGGFWRERLGLLPVSLQQSERSAIWVHAVSVGETLAVVGLVRELQQLYPGRKVFLSHVTPAGREAGESRLPDVAGRFYAPLDWHWAVRRALARLRPALLVIVETELWPNLLRTAHEFGTRVVLVNGRISDRSFHRYRLAKPFLRRLLENVDRICAQTTKDAERLRVLGARPERTLVTGNLKFDGKPPQLGEFSIRLSTALRDARRSPRVVAASTMPGEETMLIQAWKQIRSRHSRALLILAPRHPARFESVARLLAGEELRFVRRTALETGQAELARQLALPEILLLDSIGELAGVFELADVVFMGGSLVPTGGHNLLEPAFWAKPILFGPHMENFRDTAELFLRARAAMQVSDAAELARTALELLDNPESRRQLGEGARKALEQESGATRRVLEQLNKCLQTEAPAQVRA